MTSKTETVARLREMADDMGFGADNGIFLAGSVATEHSADLRALLSTLTSLEAERDRLREALQEIAEMTDPDQPDSYRADDREGCLDAVHARAAALTPEPKP